MAIWELTPLLEGKRPEELADELRLASKDFSKLRPTLNKDINTTTFLKMISQKESILRIASRLSAYSSLWLSENTSDSKRTALLAMTSEACADADNETLFLNIWFKSLSENSAKRLINSSGKYRYLLERMRVMSAHTLSEKEEQIITVKELTGSESLTRLYDIITNGFTFEFNGKKISQEEIGQYRFNPDRKKRILAYKRVLERYGAEQNSLGDIYSSLVSDWKNEQVRLRKFASPINARNMHNDISDQSVTALLSVVQKNVKLFRDYFVLKAKLLGIQNFDRSDLYAPYSGEQAKHPYEKSIRTVLETYKSFHPDAEKFARDVIDKKRVHSEIIPNKRSGAFCYSTNKDQVPYVLLNHVGTLNDVFTIAHELGHAIHSQAASGQTDYTFHASLPLAETASTFGEMLLSHELMKHAGKEERIAILLRMLDGQYGSIGRQGYFTLFELSAHHSIAKGATIEELNSIYSKTLHDQFGKKIGVPEYFQHEWKYVPHFYHTPFYCYSYAFGNLLVLSLYRMYQKDQKGFPKIYMDLLAKGGSASPQSILSSLGVDINQESFWQSGFDIIREEIKELRSLIS